MEREPCLWMQTGQDTEHLRSRMVIDEDGRPKKQRFPQRGMQGDYENPLPAQGTRFVWMINDYGNEIAFVLTCGAAHLDPTTGFGQYQMAQARFLGYYQPGQCPCALLATGELKPHHITDKSILKDSACAQGSFSYENRCKHSKSERAARMARARAEFDEVQRAYKGEGLNATEDAVQKLTEVVTTLAHAQDKKAK